MSGVPDAPGTPRVQAKRAQRAATPESLVLAACLRLAAHHPKVAWIRRAQTGAARYTGAGGKQRFVRFGWTGCSDLLGQTKTGKLLAIEVKRPGGRATSEQEQFLSMVVAWGGYGVLVDDVAALNRYLNGIE